MSAIKPSTAKITDFETSFDVAPVMTPQGEVIWADVQIDYVLSGLAPRVTIRVPVTWNPDETVDQRRSKALRCARELIDHACRAGAGTETPDAQGVTVEGVVEAISPVIEGLAQELGLAEPTTQPHGNKR